MKRRFWMLALVFIAGCGTTIAPVKHGPATPIRYLGVVINSPTRERLAALGAKIGRRPDLDEYYVKWGQPFERATTKNIASAGALPMISWEPFNHLADIADGGQDAYIRSWARAIAAYHGPVALSFGAEMNGPWEDWGPQHNTPAQFVAAWRHIHDLFRAAGATNVTWIWTVNNINGLKAPLQPYWPGSAYVTWVGMDGYWCGNRSPQDVGLTFDSIFGPTLAEVRQFTDRPIAETAGAPGWKVTAVQDLFSGVEHTPGILGFVWFDLNAQAADWRLETSPSALAAFRREVEQKLAPER